MYQFDLFGQSNKFKFLSFLKDKLRSKMLLFFLNIFAQKK